MNHRKKTLIPAFSRKREKEKVTHSGLREKEKVTLSRLRERAG